MAIFLKIIITFIVNSMITPEERKIGHPNFNIVKILILTILTMSLFTTINLVKKKAVLYDFLEARHPKVLEEFRLHWKEHRGEKKRKELK